MRFLKIALVLCLLVPNLYAQQTNSRNYIIKRVNKQSGANPDDVSKVITQVQYFDGLGRPTQTVTVGQSPSGHDFVEPVEYDAAGRIIKQYLPYISTGNGAFQGSALTAAGAWYTANTAGLKATDLGRPYLETTFEPAPTSRVATQRAPGNNSANSTKKYKVNGANQINRYDYDAAGNTVVQNAQYAAGTLTYTNFTDEQGNVTNEFTDMLGQLVCRQVIAAAGNTLSTYYVYDDLGLLRAVLQPNYQDVASLTDHAFTYDYDDRGRMIVKRVPGGGVTEMVYDQYDRLAASRDANQLARGVWGFIKYDALDRPIATGEIVSAATRQTWATNVDLNTLHHEDRANGTVQGYTLDKTAPKNATVDNLLTITFYDDYGFSKAAYHAYDGYLIPSFNGNVKGHVTGGRTRMLPGNGSTGSLLTHANYYDAEYRSIQTVRDLYDLGSGVYERSVKAYKYDLAPVVEHEEFVQVFGVNQAYALLRAFSYDHADRLLSVLETVATPQQMKDAYLASYRYNTLGNLQSKWFYNLAGIKYKVRTDHTYNIRGWLTDALSVYKKTTNDPDFSVFGYGLTYVNGANYTNGNISQMQWRNKDEASFTKGLNFTYDGANRLIGSSGIGGYTDTESNITYDKSGNLKTLTRAGSVADNLTYAYTGNRLTTVTDASGSNLGVKNGVSTYVHDGNGNIITDGNRGATITYNPLNLPKTVTVGGKTLTYDYDASGAKQKYVSDTLTIKYAGPFEYRLVGVNNVPYRASLTEGQAIFKNGVPFFEFYLKDHLGNVRVLFDTTGKIKQRNDYYPFGLSIDRNVPMQTPTVRNGINRYLYNEKELQVGTGYLDYGARMYMPEIGRWMAVDPVTEKMPSSSSYSYAFNNPLRFIDVGGLIPYPITIRSFAPFSSFGFGFHGDNRGYSTSANASARAHQRINFDTDKTSMSAQAWSSPTYMSSNPNGAKRALPSIEFTNGLSIKDGGDSKTFGFGTHSAAANPKTPHGTPDIDVFSNFSITENKKAGTLSLSGQLTGDNFPSTEAFINDPSGQGLFLGVGQIGADVGRNTGPFTELPGQNSDNPITSFNLTITTDKKGNFTGVQSGGKTYSITDWNNQFSNTKPKKENQ
jgi:RHS repeat-associated protein